MNIIWTVEKLTRRESDGYVTMANLKVSQDDGIGNNFITVVVSWPNGDLKIPYEQLTESEIMQWVFQSVDKQQIENALNNQPKQTDHLISSLPWNN